MLLVKIAEVYSHVLELAALAVEAAALHIGGAVRHAILAGDVSLLLKLVLTVGESTAVAIFAVLCCHPKLAQLRLCFLLELKLRVLLQLDLHLWLEARNEGWGCDRRHEARRGERLLHGQRGEEVVPLRLSQLQFDFHDFFATFGQESRTLGRSEYGDRSNRGHGILIAVTAVVGLPCHALALLVSFFRGRERGKECSEVVLNLS